MKRPRVMYRFGPYTLDDSARRLLKGGADIPLNGKAFDLLAILVKSGGAALSREQLYERLWPNEEVEDGNLSQNVYLIRRALDRGDGRHYIQTIPRFGYRFCADVTESQAPLPRALMPLQAMAAVLVAAVLTLGGSSAAPNPTSLSAAARESYALGVYHLYLRTPSELGYARDDFEETVRRAPRAAAGYAGLESVYALLAEYYADGSRNRVRDVHLAEKYRDAALARDAHDSDALAAAGFIAYRFDQNATLARRDLVEATSSNNAAAHHWLGVLLLIEGDTSAAIAQFETAHRLEPTSEVFTRWLARAYAYQRRPDDALRMATEALRIEPEDEAAMLVRACALEERGDLRGALQTLQTIGRDPWEVQFVAPDEARIQALLNPMRRRALVAHVDAAVAHRTVDPFETALFYLTVGLNGRANTMLHAIHPSLVTTGIDENDPRFKLLRPIRLAALRP